MKRFQTIWIAVVLCLFATTALAQDAAAPKTFDELLRRVEAGWRQDRSENKKREAEFVAAKNEQKRLLEEAIATRKREEKRSADLEALFQKNEIEITELEELLAERLGNLGELFGVVRQVAGETRGHLEGSLVSAQIPGRAEALGELAESKALPSVDQLRGLWSALVQEMAESGRVVRFNAPVIDAGGTETTRAVVRVGVFNAISDGKYLQWSTDAGSGKLAELGRQPAGRILASATALEQATSGPVRVSVDPSRGSILRLLVQTPSVRERIEFGGPVGYTIIALGLVTVLFGLARMLYVLIVSRKVAAQKKSKTANEGNPLGRVLKVYADNKTVDAETLELKLDEAVLRESNGMERFLWAIKVVSVVAPLMGLLGTVTGMIRTFQSIMLFGAGNPKMMAGGISEALVTTMLGLYVAIPLVLLHSWLSSMSRGVVDVLDEQSAGLVALQAEQEQPE